MSLEGGRARPPFCAQFALSLIADQRYYFLSSVVVQLLVGVFRIDKCCFVRSFGFQIRKTALGACLLLRRRSELLRFHWWGYVLELRYTWRLFLI